MIYDTEMNTKDEKFECAQGAQQLGLSHEKEVTVQEPVYTPLIEKEEKDIIYTTKLMKRQVRKLAS